MIPLDNLFFADVYNDYPELVELDNGMTVYYKTYGKGNGGGIGKQMVIKNTQEYCRLHPCSTVKLHFHVCTKGYGCQPKVVVGTCPCDNPSDNTNLPKIDNITRATNGPYADHISNPTRILPNACCGTKGYNTEEQICCHDKLYEKPFDEVTGKTSNSVMCCGHHKYTVGSEKCCINSGEEFGAEFVLKGVREMCESEMSLMDYL